MANDDWVRKAIERDYARATEAGRLAELTEPRAAKATCLSRHRLLQIELKSGATLRIPVRMIRELKRASVRELRAVEVLGAVVVCTGKR